MQTQIDYEGDVCVAVFRSETPPATLETDLRQVGIDTIWAPLPPGRYQLADRRLGRNARAAILWAVVGAVIGAAIGAGLVLYIFGAALWLGVWLPVTLAGGGAVVGGLFGVQRSAGYDDDVARWITVGPDGPAVAVRTRTPHAVSGFGHTRELLERAGAIAFLDVPMFEAGQRSTASEAATNTAAPTSSQAA